MAGEEQTVDSHSLSPKKGFRGRQKFFLKKKRETEKVLSS